MDMESLMEGIKAVGPLVGTTATHPAKTVVNGERKATKCSDPKRTKEEQQRYEKEKRKNPKSKHELFLRLRKRGLATSLI